MTLPSKTSTSTAVSIDTDTADWNAYSAANIELYCPQKGARIIGTSSTCPYCAASLSALTHWKWYSPDEPRPTVGDGSE